MVTVVPPKAPTEEGDRCSPTKEGDETIEPIQALHLKEGRKPPKRCPKMERDLEYRHQMAMVTVVSPMASSEECDRCSPTKEDDETVELFMRLLSLKKGGKLPKMSRWKATSGGRGTPPYIHQRENVPEEKEEHLEF